ncbi:MAG: metallophosphoesterase family protein [Planctomycetota bacterium]
MMRTAILSDIHGNLAALDAVQEDLVGQNVDRIVCLGDVVGYGPDPRDCLDRVMDFDFCILGNHDSSALFDPEGFNASAEGAIFWTRRQIEYSPEGPEMAIRRMEYLCQMPRVVREPIASESGQSQATDRSPESDTVVPDEAPAGMDTSDGTDPSIPTNSPEILFVHGSPRGPTHEYVFPEDVQNLKKMDKLFTMIKGVCFQGHTHVPGVFTNEVKFIRPDEIPSRFVWQPGKQRLMVNVGSVGQPRDGDSRSCYVIFDDNQIEFRRVRYDIDTTVQKILAEPELDDLLGHRLREGR